MLSGPRCIIYRTVTDGFAFNRELVLLYVCTGLAVASIGQGRRMLYIIRDWLPFALVLIAYDLSRGAADMIGRPTLWEWPADVDRWMFFGTMPTVWLQEQLKLPQPPWWEVVISSVYMSFFILPYVVAAVLWLRDREEWKAFVKLFVGAVGRGLGDLRDRACRTAMGRRPLHAGRCRRRSRQSAVHVQVGARGARRWPARRDAVHPGRRQQLDREDRRPRLGQANLHSATALLDQGQASVNLVAAIPSLHAGMTAAVAMFLWNRVHRGWRPVLVAYPLIMAFTLVYTAEHYVIDILLGWALAVVVIVALNRYEARRQRAAADDPPKHGARYVI